MAAAMEESSDVDASSAVPRDDGGARELAAGSRRALVGLPWTTDAGEYLAAAVGAVLEATLVGAGRRAEHDGRRLVLAEDFELAARDVAGWRPKISYPVCAVVTSGPVRKRRRRSGGGPKKRHRPLSGYGETYSSTCESGGAAPMCRDTD